MFIVAYGILGYGSAYDHSEMKEIPQYPLLDFHQMVNMFYLQQQTMQWNYGITLMKDY